MSAIKTYYGYNKNYKPQNYKDNKQSQEDGRNYISLPSASTLLEYEELSEGAADRIIEMIEIEQVHRHKVENYNIKVNNFYKYLNLVSQLIILFSILISAIYFSSENSSISLAIVIGGFAFLIINNIKNLMKHKNQHNKNFKNGNKHNYNKEQSKKKE